MRAKQDTEPSAHDTRVRNMQRIIRVRPAERSLIPDNAAPANPTIVRIYSAMVMISNVNVMSGMIS